jgi:hypothetical protein
MTEMMEFFKKTGAQGGKKRAANLTKKELTAIREKGPAPIPNPAR